MASDADARYMIRIADTGISYSCERGSSLLEASALLGGGGLRAGCRSGGCGVCKVRIESGQVITGRMSLAHVDAEGRAQGYVLACRAYPASDITLRLPAARTQLGRPA